MSKKSTLLLGSVLIAIALQGCAESTDCTVNACGSCGELGHTPGDGCEGGVWACDDKGNIVCQPSEKNPCGGTVELAQYGEACGVCGSYVCNGIDALRCEEKGKNACGSCEILEHNVGDLCEGGAWACQDGHLTCLATSELNPCGGSTKLALYGTSCGDCGTYECDGPNALKCVENGKNACGGCEVLDHEPGDDCEGGKWTCSEGGIVCKASQLTEPNACGGMTEIDEPGSACGVCGKYECVGTDALRCNDPGQNACGGCEPLEQTPGDACGDCGIYVCDTNDSIKCDDAGKNGCGGCEPLVGEPGSKCGDAECALWTCDGIDNVICGTNTMNSCGGCDPLEHEPGETCKGEHACCSYQCDGAGNIYKDDHDANACGGCGKLDAEVGAACEDGYGQWACDTSDVAKNNLKCVCDEQNACGGCDQSQNVGDACITCDRGFDGRFDGHLACHDTQLICSDYNDTVENAESITNGQSYSDKDDNIYSWPNTQLEYNFDVDYYIIEEVTDDFGGILKPEVWILGNKGLELCVYIHENRSPATVDYTCSGTGYDAENELNMTVSATVKDTLVLKDGTRYDGFCTKPSDSGYKYIQINNFSSWANNSLSMYIRVRADGTNNKDCLQYYLRYRF